MRTHRRRLLRRAAYAFVSIAILSVTLIVPSLAGGTDREEAEAWKSAFRARPQVSTAERMIVVLTAPSLADRVAAADGRDTPERQREWTAQALESQRALVRALHDGGVALRRDHVYARTFNGFSAVLSPEAIAALEASPLVAGLYPVRIVYPASVSADALTRAPSTGGLGSLDPLRVAGLDGSGVTVALLDTGVDLTHPALAGRIDPGHDLIGKRSDARAARNPDNRSEIEQHGTQMAALLVGASAAGAPLGLVPGASVLPLRVLGWQEADDGTSRVFGRGDQLLAGIELAVDPDGDGAVDDRAEIIAAPVVEPFAAFAGSPESRSAAGALVLGSLVVAPTGNDGPAHAGSATVGAPASSPAALAVGAADLRALLPQAQVVLTIDGAVVFEGTVPLLSPPSPVGTAVHGVSTLSGPSLADPERPPGTVVAGGRATDFFDPSARSRVAGRAALLPADGGPAVTSTLNASRAGASAVLFYGSALPAGALGIDPEIGLPVLSVPAGVGAALADALAAGQRVDVEISAAAPSTNADLERVAAFTSRGVTPDGTLRPDVSAPGVTLPTAAAGADESGSPRYATVSGSSGAAVVAAAAAALVLQSRPELDAKTLKAVLVGSSRALAGATEYAIAVAQGAGLVDPAAALETRVLVDPPVISIGRPGRGDWMGTATLTVRNITAEPVLVEFGLVPDGDGTLPLDFAVDPATLVLRAGEDRSVRLVTRTGAPADTWDGWISGTLLVSPRNGAPVRVPWATAFDEAQPDELVAASRLSPATFAASDSPVATVLTFRAGRLERHEDGLAVTSIGRLEIELWKGDELIGVLTRLRDLLPGRYTVGLSGLRPDGEPLGPGRYRLRFVARASTGSDGVESIVVGPAFTVTASEGLVLNWGGESFGPDERPRFERWLAGRGLSYKDWRRLHPTTACDVLGDCLALASR